MPTPCEAALIAEVRRDVAAAVGLQVAHTDRESVLQRYRDLMATAAAKAGAQALPLTSEGIQT
jgi:hypothetical protein